MNNLGSILKQQGRSQIWLATRLGVSGATVGNWIAGRTSPGVIEAVTVSTLLGVEVLDIWPND